jgi:hypothetical protein
MRGRAAIQLIREDVLRNEITEWNDDNMLDLDLDRASLVDAASSFG